jgi:hypothetical protein
MHIWNLNQQNELELRDIWSELSWKVASSSWMSWAGKFEGSLREKSEEK